MDWETSANRKWPLEGMTSFQSDPRYLLRKAAAAKHRSENTLAVNIECPPAFFRIRGESQRSSRYIFIICGTVGCFTGLTKALQTSRMMPRTVPLDVGVGSIQITQRFVQATPHGLENKPFVLRMRLRPRHCQAELKRHIETRRAWHLAIELHAGQVVNRKRATLDEARNPVEPPVACDSERGFGHQRQCAHGGDVCEILPGKLRIVGDVQEDGFSDFRHGDSASPSSRGRRKRATGL
jgi:hypothetical protein